jgi:hypothetical protein
MIAKHPSSRLRREFAFLHSPSSPRTTDTKRKAISSRTRPESLIAGFSFHPQQPTSELIRAPDAKRPASLDFFIIVVNLIDLEPTSGRGGSDVSSAG